MYGHNLPPIGEHNLEGLCHFDDGSPLHHKICITPESAMASLMLKQNVPPENSDWVRIWARARALYNRVLPVDTFDATTVTLSSLFVMTCADELNSVVHDKCVCLT